ncbi:MAG: hypothetical protein HQK55_07045 [Deltaproteobacteria bacterium]|nr:hypothetical protein [Deltaproteobacteria bacterium]
MLTSYRHTFLFDPCLWETDGVYYDANGQRLLCEGRTVITHQPDSWTNEGTLRLMTDPPLELHNRYDIVPFAPGLDMTTWTSFNPEIEILHGRFIIVEDAIISPWKSTSGEFWGTEFLVQVSETEYRGRGCAFKGEFKLAGWAIRLRKSFF